MASAHLEVVTETLPEIHPFLEQLEDPEEWYKRIPLYLINTCAQVRPGRNAQQDRITSSIKNNKLINAINVADIGTDLLSDYIEFTNGTWGDDRTIDEFVSLPGDPDAYVLLLAGHTRLHSVRELAQKRGQTEQEACVVAQIHQVTSIRDILQIQLDENLHDATPPERASRVIAESFMWEKTLDPKLSITKFARANRISIDRMTDALLFVQLPTYVRDITDAGLIPFSLAAQLARALGPIKMEAEKEAQRDEGEKPAFIDLAPEHQEFMVQQAVEDRVKIELYRYITMFNEKRRIRSLQSLIKSDDKARRQRLGLLAEEDKLFELDQPISLRDLETQIARQLAATKAIAEERQRKLQNQTVRILEQDPQLEMLTSTAEVIKSVAGEVGFAALQAAAEK